MTCLQKNALRKSKPGRAGFGTAAACALILFINLTFGLSAQNADTCAQKLPTTRSMAWTQGLGMIKSGEIAQGIRQLDSLRLTGLNDSAFLKEYAFYVFRALVPEKADTQPILLKSFFESISDTLQPGSFEWKVIRCTGPHDGTKLPCFTYGATFDICKPFHFIFTGLSQPNTSVLQLGYISNHQAVSDLNHQLADRKDVATCRLYIDLNSAGTSNSEYLTKRINGVYDSIEDKSNMPGFKGVSLRCFSWPRFINEDEKYTAIASFDRPFPGIRNRPGSQTAQKEISTRSIRYTLIVQSSSDVKDLLEVKFMSMLKAFL
jgi:hypothetical protein